MSTHIKITYREALESDLATLIKMLADDQLGADREDSSVPINSAYIRAFHSIEKDPNNELIVVEAEGNIIGMLQLTFIPYLSHTGAWRGLIEAVRVHKDYRNKGIGTHILKWAIGRAKEKECFMVQLTSNKQRSNAIRFYEKLGFKATHEGFKLIL